MNGNARLYRALLTLYPPAFRREYGADLAQSFVDLARDRGLASAWTRCSVDLAVTVPRYRMEALMHRPVPSVALIAFALAAAGLAGFIWLAFGILAALPLLVIATILAVTQRSALAQSLVVAPGRRRARLWRAGTLAVVCIAAIGSWAYHVDRYDHLAGATVLLHNLIGVLSLLGAIGFGLAGLFTRTDMRSPTVVG